MLDSLFQVSLASVQFLNLKYIIQRKSRPFRIVIVDVAADDDAADAKKLHSLERGSLF